MQFIGFKDCWQFVPYGGNIQTTGGKINMIGKNARCEPEKGKGNVTKKEFA
jgi:hypothetical protein